MPARPCTADVGTGLYSRMLSRRRLLQVGGLGFAGLSLPRLLEAGQNAGRSGRRPRADACIVIFLNGGPSHLDMWDMKPDTAAGIRGEFRPIASSLPGCSVCELLPRLARQMHLACVVRSMHHSVNNAHAAAVYTSMTGHDRGDAQVAIGAGPDDYPSPAAVLPVHRPPARTIVPSVHLPFVTKEGAKGPPQPGFFGGLLGRAHDPLIVTRDPNAANFSVPELSLIAGVSDERLAARRRLFESLDRRLSTRRGIAAVDALDGFQKRALELLTSADTQRAFRISNEPASSRAAYGRNIYGQSVLLARRLIEAGTRMVTVSWAPDANATWDTHGNNFVKLKTTLLPQFDAACSSLVADLQVRGLLKRTLVAVLGDFGRTPKVNKNAGRDHWNYCYSLMLVGGGFAGGLVYGSSDKTGAFPASNALVPGDVIATIYRALGVAHDAEFRDRLDRPHRLVPAGDVVAELLA